MTNDYIFGQRDLSLKDEFNWRLLGYPAMEKKKKKRHAGILWALVAVLGSTLPGTAQLRAETGLVAPLSLMAATSGLAPISDAVGPPADLALQSRNRHGRNIAMAAGLTVITIVVIIVAAQKQGANVPFAVW
jgi:hypothetical protein